MILALFLTNIWIIIYSSLLTFLNFLSPTSPTVHFYRPAVAFPEKFEISLYLLLTFVFIILIWALHRFKLRVNKVIQVVIFVSLSILLISKLGIYPLSNDIFPYTMRSDKTIYDVVLIIYLFTIAFIIIQTTLMAKLLNSRVYILNSMLYILIVILAIAFFIFEPRFPISYLEYAFFFGPIWEIVHGKTIFTQIPSQYGFLSILFFSILFKLRIFAFSHLSIYNFIFHISQYFLCFYLIFKVSKSRTLALIGLFSIITLNYFSFHVPVLTIAQYGALRRLPFFLGLFLFYKFKKIDSPIFIFLYALFTFWIVDSGIQMILAYGLTLFILFLAGAIDIKRSLKAGLIFFLSLAGIFISINVLHILFGYQSINVFEITSTLRQYALSGVGMIPIQTHTYFWLIILVYFASVIYFFRTNSINILRVSSPEGVPSAEGISESRALGRGRDRPRNIVLILSANLMLFACLYFVGRSDDASLIVISIFPILTTFFLIGHEYKNISSSRIRIASCIGLFILFIALPAYSRKYTMTELLLKKYQGLTSGNIFSQELEANLNKRFSKEKELITKYLTDDKVLILSSDDTYLLYLTGKKNLLDENPQSGIESDVEMEFALKNIKNNCPKNIAVDCSVVNKCSSFTPLTKGWLTANHILKAVENKCHKIYKPVICTDQLCIAETN